MENEQTFKPLDSDGSSYFPSFQQLNKMFHMCPDVICAADSNGSIIYAGGGIEKLWGYTNEELRGRSWLDLIVEEDREQNFRISETIKTVISVSNYENRVYKKNGSIIPMTWSLHWDPEENILLGIGRDSSELKKAEALVNKKNMEVDDILDRVSDGFYAIDKTWKLTYINRRGAAILRFDPKDVLGKNIWEHFPEAVNTIIYQKYFESYRKQVSLTFEMYYEPLDTWFEVNTHASPEGLSVFFRDISERKKTEKKHLEFEKKIQDQYEFLLNIVENMKQGYVNIGMDGKIYYWNKEAERISGVPRHALLHKNFWESYPDTIDSTYAIFFEQLKKTRESLHHEYYTKKNKWLEFHVYPINEGFSIFFRDISERKINEEELKKLSHITQKASNLIIITDAEGKITWVNDAFIKTTGYTLLEATGSSPMGLLHGPETDPNLVRLINKKIKEHKPYHVELIIQTKNYQKVWSVIDCQPNFDMKGNIKEFFVILTDITEIRELQQKLILEEKKNQNKITTAVIKAQETERMLVSHELHDNVNQVLSTVKMYNEMSLEDFQNSKDFLTKSVNLLNQSIVEIRNLSQRLSAPTLGSIKFDDSIKDLVDTIAAHSSVNIELKMNGLQSLNVGSELHLSVYRIMQEHLTNVLKHANATHLMITVERKAKNLIIRAIDNGQGFDTAKKMKGIGITNMISRAESVGGRLQVISAPGIGCEMIAEFPLKK